MSNSQSAFNSDDLVNKIVQATTLESEGKLEEAISIYQRISELDPKGNYGDVAREALGNLQKSAIPTAVEVETIKAQSSSWWSRLSIKLKTSIVLVGITLTSTFGISLVAYTLANETINQETNNAEASKSYTITRAIGSFIHQRYGDIQTLSNLSIVSDPELRTSKSKLQKQAILSKYLKSYGVYSEITAFDLKGNVIASSGRKNLIIKPDDEFFKNIILFNQPAISQPIVSPTSDVSEIHFASPIKDTTSGQTIGVIYAIVPGEKISEILQEFKGNQKSYVLDNRGQVFLSSYIDQEQNSSTNDQSIALNSLFDFSEQLEKELNLRRNNSKKSSDQKYSLFQGKQNVAYLYSLADIDAGFSKDISYLNWAVLTSVDKKNGFAAQRKLLEGFLLGAIITTALIVIAARLIASRATKPISDAAEAVRKLGKGDFEVRVPVTGADEIADLGTNINKMAGQIQDLLHTQESETQRQRQEKENLQKGVMGLLLDVEDAKKGDLTVRAEMSDGAIGSIADAFNTTLNKLQELLQEVQNVSTEVGELSQAGEGSVKKLSESALAQAAEIEYALSSIDEINQSVKTIADYAQEAAVIARNGSIQAKEGDLAMDATVNSIEKIRATVANTSKKVKQLAESSQEIAQIVEIISGISEKTNLLAFNASVEAARAGEHGEGFRIVAEEVRRLADRITGATKDIQQLVGTIQQDTTSVLQGMETSTSEVVNGSELVHMTKLNLQSLAKTSQQIDEYLKSISTNTTKQTQDSKQVNEKINGIALVAKTTSTEAQTVVKSLQILVEEAQTLQESVSQFKL